MASGAKDQRLAALQRKHKELIAQLRVSHAQRQKAEDRVRVLEGAIDRLMLEATPHAANPTKTEPGQPAALAKALVNGGGAPVPGLAEAVDDGDDELTEVIAAAIEGHAVAKRRAGSTDAGDADKLRERLAGMHPHVLARSLRTASRAASDKSTAVELPFKEERPSGGVVQEFTAAHVARPLSDVELVAAMRSARAKGIGVRAVGSGLSFSDVAHTAGVLLRTDGLDRIDLAAPPSVVADVTAGDRPHPAVPTSAVVRVEAGARVRSVNEWLTEHDLALFNQGAYDGQTVAGAFATGTHGSCGFAAGHELPPMADQVRSFVLLRFAADGRELVALRVEPESRRWCTARDGEPTGESVGGVPVTMRVSDELFAGGIVSCGALGVIYSLAVAVRTHYSLEEWRFRTTLADVRANLNAWLHGAGADGKGPYDYVEALVSPYDPSELVWSTRYRRESLTCVVTLRRTTKEAPRGKRPGHVGVIIRKFLNGVMSTDIPTVAVGGIELALRGTSLASREDSWVGPCTKVLSVESANFFNARSVEFGVPVERWEAAVNALLGRLHELANLGVDNTLKHHEVVTSPFALRFTSPSRATISMSGGRSTCMIEVPSIGTNGSLSAEIASGVYRDLSAWLTGAGEMRDEIGARMHWGQLQSVDGKQAAAAFGGDAIKRFSSLVADANRGHDTFVNPFVARVFTTDGGDEDDEVRVFEI